MVALSTWTRTKTHYEVMHQLQAAGIAAVPCLDALELVADPQLQALGLMVEIEHPEVGVRAVAGVPGRLSELPEYAYTPAPLIGQHNREVLCGLLGLGEDDLERLVEESIVF